MKPIVVWFWRLRDGVPAKEYERFLREVDLPVLDRIPSVLVNRPIRVMGPMRGDDNPQFDYIDVAEITGLDEYLEDIETHPALSEVEPRHDAFAESLGNFWAIPVED